MGENGNIIDVPAVPSGIDLIEVAKQADALVEAVRKIKAVVFKLTNNHDWIDQGGKPYLQASGAQKVARAFGISWTIDEPTKESLDGGHYMFTYKGAFSLHGACIDAIGTRSSKDGFFKKYGSKDAAGNRTELPPSEIDPGDVKKSAFTNCLGNGISALLGIKNLTWEELNEAGIKKDEASRVDYGSSKEQRTGKINEAQRKRFYALCKTGGWSDDAIKAYMKNILGIETSNDIPVARYEEACTWAQSGKKEGEPDAG